MLNIRRCISCRSVYRRFFDEDEIGIIPFSNFLPLELSTSKKDIQDTWDHSAYANTFSSAVKYLIIERAPSKVLMGIAVRSEPIQQHSSLSSHNGILVNIYLLYFCFVVRVCGFASVLAKNRRDTLDVLISASGGGISPREVTFSVSWIFERGQFSPTWIHHLVCTCLWNVKRCKNHRAKAQKQVRPLMRKIKSCVLKFSTSSLMNWGNCRWTPLPSSTNRRDIFYFHYVCKETPCLNSWSNFVTHFVIIILCGNRCNLYENETTLTERQEAFPSPPYPPTEITKKYNLSSLFVLVGVFVFESKGSVLYCFEWWDFMIIEKVLRNQTWNFFTFHI